MQWKYVYVTAMMIASHWGSCDRSHHPGDARFFLFHIDPPSFCIPRTHQELGLLLESLGEPKTEEQQQQPQTCFPEEEEEGQGAGGDAAQRATAAQRECTRLDTARCRVTKELQVRVPCIQLFIPSLFPCLAHCTTLLLACHPIRRSVGMYRLSDFCTPILLLWPS